MAQIEDDYLSLLKTANADPAILGLILEGSRGKGFATQFSDYDISLIVHEAAVSRLKVAYQTPPPGIEIFIYTLEEFMALAAWESDTAWDRYNYTHLTAQIDKLDGYIQTLIDEKGRVPPNEVANLIGSTLDHYINQVYRSLKCLRVEDKLGYHFEAVESIRPLLTALFALHGGRLLPYYKYLLWELNICPLDQLPFSTDTFLAYVQRIASDGDFRAQQTILRAIEPLFRAEGYAAIFDSWEGKDRWAMHFQPDEPI